MTLATVRRLLVLPLTAWGICAHALDQQVTIRVGQSISAAVPTNLVGVRVASTNVSIANPSYRQDRLTITGIHPGRATVTMTAERMRYLAGFNTDKNKTSPHVNAGQDMAEYYDVVEKVEVTVVGAPAPGKPEPKPSPFPDISANDYLVVKVGKSISATLPGGSSGVRASSSAPGVAGVTVVDGRVTIRGIAEGSAVVTVSGEITRFLVGFSIGGKASAHRGEDMPLGETSEFNNTYLVEVTSDESKKPAEPKRVAAPPEPVYEICQLSRRSMSIPGDVGPLVVKDGGEALDIEQKPARIVMTPKSGARGDVTLSIEEKKPRLNKPLFRDKIRVRIVPCDLSGEWIGGGGFTVTQNGNTLTARSADGKVFTGTVSGRDVRLTFAYTNLAQTPKGWPDDVRKALVSQHDTIELKLTIIDEGSDTGDGNLVGTLSRGVLEQDLDNEDKVTLKRKDDKVTYRRKTPHTGVRAAMSPP
jgi:hypothetical protein